MKNRSKKDPGKIGNTSQSSPRYLWCFVLNNWTEEEYRSIVLYFSEDKYIIGKEVGDEGTPHLQGHVELKTKRRLTELKKLNERIHWEPVRNKTASRDYCKKDKNFETNMKIPRPLKFPEFNRNWQMQILELIEEEPDDRTIHWFWEEVGGCGKTTFVKYLKSVKGAIECPSKSADAFHRIAKAYEEEIPIDIVVFDIPRSALEFINYGAIEKIKDGNVCSGKYEGCDCVYACPHVIVFANEPPKEYMLSRDRWKIEKIEYIN